jgi:DNA adenine methylase
MRERMRSVVIECRDFAALIRQWDTEDTLFYCDPPYIGTEHYYAQDFGDAQHKTLAEALNSVKGRVVLSYGEHGSLDEMYPADRWARRVISGVSTSSAGGSGPRPRRNEVILANFDFETRRRFADGQ